MAASVAPLWLPRYSTSRYSNASGSAGIHEHGLAENLAAGESREMTQAEQRCAPDGADEAGGNGRPVASRDRGQAGRDVHGDRASTTARRCQPGRGITTLPGRLFFRVSVAFPAGRIPTTASRKFEDGAASGPTESLAHPQGPGEWSDRPRGQNTPGQTGTAGVRYGGSGVAPPEKRKNREVTRDWNQTACRSRQRSLPVVWSTSRSKAGAIGAPAGIKLTGPRAGCGGKIGQAVGAGAAAGSRSSIESLSTLMSAKSQVDR